MLELRGGRAGEHFADYTQASDEGVLCAVGQELAATLRSLAGAVPTIA